MIERCKLFSLESVATSLLLSLSSRARLSSLKRFDSFRSPANQVLMSGRHQLPLIKFTADQLITPTASVRQDVHVHWTLYRQHLPAQQLIFTRFVGAVRRATSNLSPVYSAPATGSERPCAGVRLALLMDTISCA